MLSPFSACQERRVAIIVPRRSPSGGIFEVVVTYDFLIDSYESERIKVLSVWSEFREEDLDVRPKPDDARGRSVREQMVHQCVSEDTWFRTMLGIDAGAPPLPEQETRLDFIARVGIHAPPDAHVASSRAADGDAADARSRSAQQLRTDRRYRRTDAAPCTDDLRLCQHRCAA